MKQKFGHNGDLNSHRENDAEGAWTWKGSEEAYSSDSVKMRLHSLLFIDENAMAQAGIDGPRLGVVDG
uniref:Uncharacterized protein n=1 Tax=Cucumis melo TaxID=3656 RepID=A0A9I9DTY9_CUCME